MEQEEIQKTLEILREGGMVVYPTDTIWGLGCDATNPEAVAKIYDVKERDSSKSLILLVSGDAMLQRYVKVVPEVCWDLIDMADKPLTIVYPEGNNLAPKTMADDGSIGIRMVKEGFVNKLVHKLGRPLVSTSANISGEPSPTSFDEISDELKSRVDYVVNLRLPEKEAQPSSIIKVGPNGEIKIIRE